MEKSFYECDRKSGFQNVDSFFDSVVWMVRQFIDSSPSGLSHPPRDVKFACEASVVVQVKGAEHLPDPQHVAPHYLLEGPGILVVLLHISLLLMQLC